MQGFYLKEPLFCKKKKKRNIYFYKRVTVKRQLSVTPTVSLCNNVTVKWSRKLFFIYREWSIKHRDAYFNFLVLGAALMQERRLLDSGAYFNYG